MEHGRTAVSPPGRILTHEEWSSQIQDWHYLGSRCRGVIFSWGHSEGCCVFTNPRSREISKWFPELIVQELARMVGKPNHMWAMSSLMSDSIKECKRRGWDILITYADPSNSNTGSVYRAANWIPFGESTRERVWYLDDIRVSRRSMYDKHGTQSVPAMKVIYGDRLRFVEGFPKPRFIYGVSRKGRKFITNPSFQPPPS